MVKRHRKGGFPGITSIANQAVVPFFLVGLNQSYKKKGNKLIGGAGGAAGYVDKIAGSTTIGQLDRTFDGIQPGNALILTNGKSVGGMRKKSRKGKKGGQWAEILNQAVVPAAILGLQQTYKKRGGKGGKRTKRHR